MHLRELYVWGTWPHRNCDEVYVCLFLVFAASVLAAPMSSPMHYEEDVAVSPFDGLNGSVPTSWQVQAEDVLVPVGVWVTNGTTVGFTYIDPSGRLLVQREVDVPKPLPARLERRRTVDEVLRSLNLVGYMTWRGPRLRVLTDAERQAKGLPLRPEWLVAHLPQPPAGTLWGTWRLDPRLWGRFPLDRPDDVLVLFDEPSALRREIMRVRLRGCDDERCWGTLLNAPFYLHGVAQGDRVRVSLTTGSGGPLSTRRRGNRPLSPYVLMEGTDSLRSGCPVNESIFLECAPRFR